MPLEQLNRAGFAMLDMTQAGPGAVASLEALAVAPVFLLPVLIAGLWLLGGRDMRRTAVLAGTAGALAMVTAHLASVLIDHPRPFMAGLAPNLLDHAADSSFPSDHATLFFALAVVFARRPLPTLPGLEWALAGLGFAVGLARVALGIHFPLDVAGAALIGAAAALAAEGGLRPAVDTLVRLGERLRVSVGPLAARDGHERAGSVDAHPAG